MKVFVELTHSDLDRLKTEYNSIPMLIISRLRKIVIENPDLVVVQVKIKKNYDIPPHLEKIIKEMAKAEGLSVSKFVLKYIIYPELHRLRSLGK